jgi:Fur family transcriptional regulator, ferric uptake regulator
VNSADDWRTALRKSGHRLTPQRELILQAVQVLGHATPDEVLAHVRQSTTSVNLSTIYRTLELLQDLGLVRHAHLVDRAPTYHSVGGPEHFHLVCRSCKVVISAAPAMARRLAEDLAATHGFTTDVGHLTVFGNCQECKEK